MMMMLATILSVAAFAQKDVTKFLGIPLDGTVQQMKDKLKKKGFTDDPYGKGVLAGRFNGKDVFVNVAENKGKVFRILVSDQNLVNEADIKINFNNLCHQFHQNKKYFPIKTEAEDIIPDGENISYELTVHKKRYQAAFLQFPTDTTWVRKTVMENLQTKYTMEQIQAPASQEQKEDMENITNETVGEIMQKHLVWMTISEIEEYPDRYYLSIFYDNGYNMANGEDL